MAKTVFLNVLRIFVNKLRTKLSICVLYIVCGEERGGSSSGILVETWGLLKRPFHSFSSFINSVKSIQSCKNGLHTAPPQGLISLLFST